jgi:hypothetical protein
MREMKVCGRFGMWTMTKGPGYRVHYYYREGDAFRYKRIAKVYPTVSAACKGRDWIMRRANVTSAYVGRVLRNGMEFCALSDRYARTK